MAPIRATNRRLVRSAFAAGLACLLSGLAAVFALLIPSASATGNDGGGGDHSTTCYDLGLKPLAAENYVATLSEDKKTLDVDANEGFKITAVILIGHYKTEIFKEPPFHGLKLPYGKEIKDYEVCGCPKHETSPPPTTTSPPPTTTSPPPTTTSPPPSETSPPPTTPAQPPPTTPAQPELPETGSGGNGWLAAAGAALLAAGAWLVLLGRGSGRHEA
jgi:LPXTG-motif cell wall-anchored protein